MKKLLLLMLLIATSSCQLFDEEEVVKKVELSDLTTLSITRASELPYREGRKPLTSSKDEDSDLAHVQVTDCNFPKYREEILKRLKTLPNIEEKRARFVASGTRVFSITSAEEKVNVNFFLKNREFLHVHSKKSCSYHMTLRFAAMALLVEKGWAEYYPKRNDIVLVYAPRNEEELEIVWLAICKSYLSSLGR